jgi:hypothetical protein
MTVTREALAGALEMVFDAMDERGYAQLQSDPRVIGARAILDEFYDEPAAPSTSLRGVLSSGLSALAAKIQRAEGEK